MGDHMSPDSGRGGKSNVIKFGKAKKSLDRQGKEKTAATNRARFGQTQSAKELKKAMTEKLQAKLNAHKVDKPDA